MKFGRLRAAAIGGALGVISFNARPAHAIAIPYGNSVLTFSVIPGTPHRLLFSAGIILVANEDACSPQPSGCFARWSLSVEQYDQNNNWLGSTGESLTVSAMEKRTRQDASVTLGQLAFGPMYLDTTTLVVSSFISVGGGWIFKSADLIIQSPAQIAETPLPAALPLFATGLGALGLLGWRRKTKSCCYTHHVIKNTRSNFGEATARRSFCVIEARRVRSDDLEIVGGEANSNGKAEELRYRVGDRCGSVGVAL